MLRTRFFQLTTNLFYRVYDSLESGGIVHREVSENLAVQADVLLGETTHELGIGEAVLTCGSVDTLDPEGAELSLLGFTVTVSIGETFLIGVLCYRPNIPAGQEIAASLLENLLAARPGGD